jgi:hypothetical protein
MPAFIASFSISQSQEGEILTIVDSSNYTAENKSTFSARKLWLYLDGGSTMLADGTISSTPAFIDFSFADYPDDTIEIPLGMDYGFNIVLELVSVSPQTGSVYSAQAIIGTLNFIMSFLQGKIQETQGQYNFKNDTNFQTSWLYVWSQTKMIANAQEFQVLSSIQAAIDRAYVYINNQNLYF